MCGGRRSGAETRATTVRGRGAHTHEGGQARLRGQGDGSEVVAPLKRQHHPPPWASGERGGGGGGVDHDDGPVETVPNVPLPRSAPTAGQTGWRDNGTTSAKTPCRKETSKVDWGERRGSAAKAA